MITVSKTTTTDTTITLTTTVTTSFYSLAPTVRLRPPQVVLPGAGDSVRRGGHAVSRDFCQLGRSTHGRRDTAALARARLVRRRVADASRARLTDGSGR